MKQLLGLLIVLALPGVAHAGCKRVCEENCAYGVCNVECRWACVPDPQPPRCVQVCGWSFDAFGRQVYGCVQECR